MILSVPEEREQWFRTLFDQFKISHRTLSEEEDFRLAELTNEVLVEESYVSEDLPEWERLLIDERLTDYRSKPEAVSDFKTLLDSLGSK